VAFIATKLGISAAYNFKKSGICADLYVLENKQLLFFELFLTLYVVLKLKFLSLNPSWQKPRKSEINVLRSIQKIEFRCSGYQQGITVNVYFVEVGLRVDLMEYKEYKSTLKLTPNVELGLLVDSGTS